ncbi:hypothetical protein FHS31_000347 [Sphingomonas vulcanisoli]|uniref:Uncharacterized protein n=1 Tax=Sphingomonas vulcanisoli TaxID=1658060 RepID=A0ABX0TRG0_9SPHN|nr:hypothetical protein [Sphingomonas vulcanisoli]NIJ06765.1 hypothetical protein [Sphingomonas vulcanisoli]
MATIDPTADLHPYIRLAAKRAFVPFRPMEEGGYKSGNTIGGRWGWVT